MNRFNAVQNTFSIPCDRRVVSFTSALSTYQLAHFCVVI